MQDRRNIMQSNQAKEDRQREIVDNHAEYFKCVNMGAAGATTAMVVTREDG